VICKATRRCFLGPEAPVPRDGPVGGSGDYEVSLANVIALGSGYRSKVRLLAKSLKIRSRDKGLQG
jgi:hypothetical protein